MNGRSESTRRPCTFSFIMDDNELISVCNNLKQLQEVMASINSSVEGLTDSNLKEKMSKMSYIESAQMHLMMAEVSINMFYGDGFWRLLVVAYLKSKGVDVNEHPIQKEMVTIRIAAIMDRSVWKSTRRSSTRLSMEGVPLFSGYEGVEMPTLRIDKEATARIIKHSIGKQ